MPELALTPKSLSNPPIMRRMMPHPRAQDPQDPGKTLDERQSPLQWMTVCDLRDPLDKSSSCLGQAPRHIWRVE
jgi:hypothetical protein